MNTQNTDQAKFLIKELLAVLKIMRKEEYDSELYYLMADLEEDFNDNIDLAFFRKKKE